MAKGIDIAIAADTRSAMSAITRGIIDPLDDVAEALETMGDDSKDATRELEKGMRDAQRDTDDAKDEIRDLRDELNKAGRQGKRSGDDIKDGFRRAEEGAEEFKDEANSTAREAAASFDGSAESIADAFQEVAANAFSGFGPAGAVAGLAAAAGIGLAIAGFEGVTEAQKESEERAAEWADAYIEAGSRALTFDQQAAKVRDIITDDEQYKTAKTNAELWGVAIDTAISAMSGSQSAIDEVTASLDTQRVAVEEAEAEAAEFEKTYGRQTSAQKLLRDEYTRGADALSLLTGEMQRGAEGADVMSRWLIDTARATEGATEKVDEFGDTIITLPDGKHIYIDAETGQATQDTDAIENKIYGIKDKTVTIDVATADAVRAAQNAVNRIGRMSATVKLRADTSAILSAARSAINTATKGWDQ